jgi:hypothetical protein
MPTVGLSAQMPVLSGALAVSCDQIRQPCSTPRNSHLLNTHRYQLKVLARFIRWSLGTHLYYPSPNSGFSYEPPPPPANHPLDIGDILRTPPGSGTLPPHGYRELAPGTG